MSRRVRLRRLSVRTKTTSLATLVLGLTMAAGSVVLVFLIHETLTDAVRDSAETRAMQVAHQSLPAGTTITPDAGNEEESVHVVDASGHLLNATPDAGKVPATLPRPGTTATLQREGLDGDYLVVTEKMRTEPDHLVVVTRSLEDVTGSTRTVAALLGVSVPLLLLVVAATTWFVVGRALRPVDRIRRQVDEISASQLDRRVAVPSARDEVGHLAVTMNRMLARLQQAQEQQRRFVSDASHELRSPIAAIRQVAETAHTHPGASDPTTMVETTLAESLRAQALIDNLLLLARSDENGLRFDSRLVDLDDLALEEATHLRTLGGLTVETSRLSAGRVRGNPAYLRQLVRNLTDNARRHARSAVNIELRERGEIVELVVDDDGPGVPIADRERIFERFVRLDSARARDAGGSGLGLSIVREIARAHRGHVTVLDAPSGGAHFVVTLPRADN